LANEDIPELIPGYVGSLKPPPLYEAMSLLGRMGEALRVLKLYHDVGLVSEGRATVEQFLEANEAALKAIVPKAISQMVADARGVPQLARELEDGSIMRMVSSIMGMLPPEARATYESVVGAALANGLTPPPDGLTPRAPAPPGDEIAGWKKCPRCGQKYLELAQAAHDETCATRSL
jgi:hypothetical protein